MIRLILIAALLGLAADAVACRGNDDPGSEDLSGYSTIFSGEVTGINLTGYEEFKARKHPSRKLTDEEMMDYVLVNNLPFEIWVVVDHEYKGDNKSVETLMLGGCSVEQPKLHERGIFFTRSGSKSSIAVLESEPDYERWLSIVAPVRE